LIALRNTIFHDHIALAQPTHAANMHFAAVLVRSTNVVAFGCPVPKLLVSTRVLLAGAGGIPVLDVLTLFRAAVAPETPVVVFEAAAAVIASVVWA
jgi:hypothetical protein